MRISDWSSDVCSSDLHTSPPGSTSPRIWKLRRPVWRERRSGVMQRLKAHACAMVRSGDQGDGALHQRRVAREAAEERRSEEHTSELQSLMRISYAVFCLKTKKKQKNAYTKKGHRI